MTTPAPTGTDTLTAITEGDQAFVVAGWSGVAWRYAGPVIDHVTDSWEFVEELADGDDDESAYVWTGCELMLGEENECSCPRSTTEIYAYMVGDDRRFVHDLDDITPIDDDDYCSGCGQIGCGHG